MSQLGNTPRRFLTGAEALDVSRMTGIPIYCRPRLRKESETPVHWSAAETALARGAWTPDDIVIDLFWLDWWDRWRVAWTTIGCYTFIRNQMLTTQEAQCSSKCSPSQLLAG